jgi:hypothetical protein
MKSARFLKSTPRLKALIPALIVVFLMGPTLAASAATRTWLNTGGGDWNSPGNWSGGEVPTTEDAVFITADGTYTVTVAATAQFASLTLGGGAGTQTLRWTGGILPGDITIQTGAVLRYALATFNSPFGDGTLNNHGTIIWEAAATQTWGLFGSSIVNHAGGLIDLQADGSIGLYGGSPSILNHGTVRKSGGTGIFYMGSGLPFTNRGTVEIQSGTLQFDSGFTSSGEFNVGEGALLDLHSGMFTLEPGHNVTGPGGYASSIKAVP